MEIQINQTATPDDDYLTWAPAFCQARVVPSNGCDFKVVLTNRAGDGDVLFSPMITPWPPDTTATDETIMLTLPDDGSWLPFVVAGKFGSPSTRDKDAVIEVHETSAAGLLVTEHACMVRVRKNAETLTDEERELFLRAMQDSNDAGVYLPFQEIHGSSPQAGDEGHGGFNQPAFAPWHRPLVLQFERALQTLKPEFRAVTVPYWNWESPSPKLFSQDFLGEGNVDGGVNFFVTDDVKFAPANPIKDWDTGVPGVRIRRIKFDHAVLPRVNPSNLMSNPFRRLHGGALPLLDRPEFGGMDPFHVWLESNPHNQSHVWNCGGGHLFDPGNATRDPLFFFLHCQIDHLWAAWQNHHNRDGTPGGGSVTFSAPQDYSNTGNWNDPGVMTLQQGSFLEDEMWPWDGTSGDPGTPADPRDDRPIGSPSTPFPQSPIAHLWPPATANPRVRDVIDYLGKAVPHDGLGFCYDDVPYSQGLPGIPMAAWKQGTSAERPLVTNGSRGNGRSRAALASFSADLARNQPSRAEALATFLDGTKPKSERTRAGNELAQAVTKAEIDAFRKLAADREVDEDIRFVAVLGLSESPDVFRDVILDILRDPQSGSEKFHAQCLQKLALLRINPRNQEKFREVFEVMRGLLNDKRHDVRYLAASQLVVFKDAAAIKSLSDSLGGDSDDVLPKHEVIELLRVAGPGAHTALIRPFLDHEDPKVRAEAAIALGVDEQSRPKIADLFRNNEQPLAVRKAALEGLRLDRNYGTFALAVVKNAKDDPELRLFVVERLVGTKAFHGLKGADQVEFARAVDQVSRLKLPEKQDDAARKLQSILREQSPALKQYYDRQGR